MARLPKTVQTAAAYRNTRRVPRLPKYHFNLETKPYQLQPFCIAPVLPGETLDRVQMQAVVGSSPIANPQLGWWNEYFWFYVKISDLDMREDFTGMFLDPDKDMSAHFEAANRKHFHYGGTINWTKWCLKRIVEEFFRNEGEEWDQFMLDGLPMVSVNRENWMDSIIGASQYEEPDLDLDLNQDGTITAGELSSAMQMYETLKQHGFIDMTYEDYLRQHGIRTPAIELHRPELLRNISSWTYPSVRANGPDGAPAPSVSWTVSETLEKPRLFKEPGFVVGLTCARPKVYLDRQAGGAIGLMNSAFSWIPPVENDNPAISLVHVPHGTGPLPHMSDETGYVIDMRDLLLYGDDFVNHVNVPNKVALPAADLQRRFALSTDIAGLFAGDEHLIRQDGICRFMVLGRQTDKSETTGTYVAG